MLSTLVGSSTFGSQMFFTSGFNHTSGEIHLDKIKRLREELNKKPYKAMVVNMLDEVAWLFNLRGSDIDYNPVFFAYSVITQDKALVFINPSQVDDTVRAHLGESVQVKSYDEFFPYLRRLGADLGLSKDSVGISNHHHLSIVDIPLVCFQQVLVGDKSSLAVAEAIGHVCQVLIASGNSETLTRIYYEGQCCYCSLTCR